MTITMKTQTHHQEMPMLAGIAGIIRWVEELANLLSGPLLTLGLGIALIDLLTDGSLLARLPLLLYAWAISQAVGVDAQLVATWDRARLALWERRAWALVGLIALGGVLAYVAWVAAQVFALQESEGVTTGVALARLGMDSAGWLAQRTALSVFLVCLAGWTRYHPPAKDVAVEAEAERQKLEADRMLEPLRQRLRAQQVRGMRGAIAAAIGSEKNAFVVALGRVETQAEIRSATSGYAADPPEHAEERDALLPHLPPGREDPAEAGSVRIDDHADGVTDDTGDMGGEEERASETGAIRLPQHRQRRGGAGAGRRRGSNPSNPSGVRTGRRARTAKTATVEAKAWAVWRPGMSVGQLQHAAGISRSAAGKYPRTFLAELASSVAAAL